MARYVAQDAPYPRSSEYVNVPGYMGAADTTETGTKVLYWGAVGVAAWWAWKKLSKKK